jgi:hypothetical protein
VGEGAKVIQDSAAVIGSQTEKTALKLQSNAASLLPQALSSYFGGSDSRSVSVHSRGISTVDSERVFAVERISQTCVRLLRKTRLQVRVAVEVIHCKSPKQLITEAVSFFFFLFCRWPDSGCEHYLLPMLMTALLLSRSTGLNQLWSLLALEAAVP